MPFYVRNLKLRKDLLPQLDTAQMNKIIKVGQDSSQKVSEVSN
jgi:hypothetical protein